VATVLCFSTPLMRYVLFDWNRIREKWLPEIEASMQAMIDEFSPAGSTLTLMSNYHLSTGGKRLRAILPIAVAESYAKDPQWMLPFSCACELLHNATLVHDDLQDGDTTRRGEETIWVKYGIPQSINVGDALLYYAIGALNKMEVPPAKIVELLSMFVQGTIQVIDGQEREFLLIENPPSMENYFTMVEGKTSGLFAIPFCGAAILCDAEPELVKKMSQASRHLGVIFQIQDDVLDIYANKGRERKGSDIAEGKRSVLATYTLLNADEKDARFVESVLNAKRENVGDEDIENVSRLFLSCGALDFALDEIQRRVVCIETLLEGESKVWNISNALIETFLKPIENLNLSPKKESL